ncbi:MAG: hypothetical protein AB7S69_09760 [Salinivirgaceae bacterium]
MKLKSKKNSPVKVNFQQFFALSTSQLQTLKGGNDETPPDEEVGKETN